MPVQGMRVRTLSRVTAHMPRSNHVKVSATAATLTYTNTITQTWSQQEQQATSGGRSRGRGKTSRSRSKTTAPVPVELDPEERNQLLKARRLPGKTQRLSEDVQQLLRKVPVRLQKETWVLVYSYLKGCSNSASVLFSEVVQGCKAQLEKQLTGLVTDDSVNILCNLVSGICSSCPALELKLNDDKTATTVSTAKQWPPECRKAQGNCGTPATPVDSSAGTSNTASIKTSAHAHTPRSVVRSRKAATPVLTLAALPSDTTSHFKVQGDSYSSGATPGSATTTAPCQVVHGYDEPQDPAGLLQAACMQVFEGDPHAAMKQAVAHHLLQAAASTSASQDQLSVAMMAVSTSSRDTSSRDRGRGTVGTGSVDWKRCREHLPAVKEHNKTKGKPKAKTVLESDSCFVFEDDKVSLNTEVLLDTWQRMRARGHSSQGGVPAAVMTTEAGAVPGFVPSISSMGVRSIVQPGTQAKTGLIDAAGGDAAATCQSSRQMELQALTVVQLKAMCSSYGLKPGNRRKAGLVDMIAQYKQQQSSQCS